MAPAAAEDLAPTEISVEKAQDWVLTGPGAASSRLSLADEKKGGVAPLAIDYKFKLGVNDYVFLEQPVPLPSAPKKIRLSLLGDGNGESVRINVTDKSGEFFQAYVAKVDWEGWKDLEVPLEFPIHWGGDDNGRMDGGVSFHSFVVNSEPEQARPEGRVLVAKIELLTEAQASAAAPVSLGRSTTITVDDFERANPLNVYQTWRGDNSSIEMASSAEFKQAGNYAMQITYRLSTTRSVPSWVSASFTPEKPLRWDKVKRLGLWVKGDGSRNYFQISFVDGDNRVWVYQTNDILKNVGWTLLEADLADFRPSPAEGGVTPKLDKIKKYEFTLLGEEAKVSSGKVWLDEFSATGTDLSPALAAPRPALTPDVLDQTKVSFGDLLHLEYKNTPEFNREFLFYNAFYIRGSAKNLTVSADIVSQEAEAGKTVPFAKSNASAPAIEPEEQRPRVELAYINATLQNIHPNLSSLSAGNLSMDYGRDIFSPVFGFKGAQAEGNLDLVNYNVFVIKHIHDAFTFGSRAQANAQGTLLRGMMVLHYDTARSLANAQNQNGQLVIPENQDVKTDSISTDKVYSLDLDRSFWEERINLAGGYAVDFFRMDALKDVTDLTAPKVDKQLFSPVSHTGRMAQGRVRLKKLPTDGTTVILGYRSFGTHFKPRFRADPIIYDTDVTDLRGYSAEVEQILGRFKVNFYYDDVDRGPADRDYYRRVFRQTYGVYDMNRWDVVVSVNKRREFYALEKNLRSEFTIDPNNPKNEDAIFYELFLGHWFTGDFSVWAKFITEKTELVSQKKNVRKDFFQMQSEYAVLKNAKLTVSVTQTRYAESSFEPSAVTAVPTGARSRLKGLEDNQVRVFLDVNF